MDLRVHLYGPILRLIFYSRSITIIKYLGFLYQTKKWLLLDGCTKTHAALWDYYGFVVEFLWNWLINGQLNLCYVDVMLQVFRKLQVVSWAIFI